jgi:hypothetical protein
VRTRSEGPGDRSLEGFDNDSFTAFFQANAGRRWHCAIPKNLHNLMLSSTSPRNI